MFGVACKPAGCEYVAAAAEKHGAIYPPGPVSRTSRPRDGAFLGGTTAGITVTFLFSFYFPFFFLFCPP